MSASGSAWSDAACSKLGVATAPLGAPGQDQPVAAVAIGPEQVGVHHRHPQRPAHAGAPSRSWNAV